MSIVLQPQASFTVVRQIENHLDTDTNYVRAVIRNAYTDAILETLDLTSRGSQRFSKNWQVPADTLGQGFYISIVTSVYSDSGYTTKNPNYGDQENTYLVQERVLQHRGGSGIDWHILREVIREEIGKIEKPAETQEPAPSAPAPKLEPARWEEVLSGLKRLQDTTDAIPKEKTDLAPLLAAIEAVGSQVRDKDVTPVTDLEPVIARLDVLGRMTEENQNETAALIGEMNEEIGQKVDALPDTLEDVVGRAEFSLGVPTVNIKKKPQPEDAPLDVNKLVS